MGASGQPCTSSDALHNQASALNIHMQARASKASIVCSLDSAGPHPPPPAPGAVWSGLTVQGYTLVTCVARQAVLRSAHI
jgi:hypothetical protein